MSRNTINSKFYQIANTDANLNITGVVLANVANTYIGGGSANQFLQTDGNGNIRWANAGTSGNLILDSYTSLGFGVLGNVAANTSLVSASGDQRASITAGRQISFAGQTQVYTVGNTITFSGGITDWSISPAAVADIPNGTLVTAFTRTPFSEVTAGNNVNLSVTGNVLTIAATGGGGSGSFSNSNSITYNTTSGTTQFSVVDGYIANIALGNASYAYRSDITFPSTYLLNNTAGRFMGTPVADRTITANLVVPANSIDGASANGWALANASNATLTGGTYTFQISDPIAVFDVNGTFNITEAQWGNGNVVAGGELNLRPLANLAAGTYPVRVSYLVNLGPSLQSVTNVGGSSNSNINLTGANVSLGNVANVKIYNGTNGQLLSTDGNGNLSWVDGVLPGLGWVMTIGVGYDTTGGSYPGWTGANAFPVFYQNGVVGTSNGFTSNTYLGATRTWSTSDYRFNSQIVADLYQQWHGTIANTLPVNTTVVDDLGRWTISTGPLATGVNPTQSDANVQGLWSLDNANAGPDFINSFDYDDASGTYPFQRAKGGAVVYTENLQQVLAAGNTANIGFTLTGAGGSIAAGGNISFTGANVSLGAVGNLQISGGSNGQVLTVANSANGLLSWTDNDPIANAFLSAAKPTGFPDPTRAQTTISFNNSTRTFSIAPTGNTFDVWVNGAQFTKSNAQTVVVPNTTGTYYVYFDNTGNLQQSTTFPGFNGNTAMTSVVYWNATNGAQYILSDERHNMAMDYATGSFIHNTIGASYASGYTISGTTNGNGNNAGDAQIGVTSGVFYDQDLRFSTNAYTNPASIPVFYRVGSAYVKDAATSYPYKVGTSTAGYNLNTSGTWSVADIATGPANQFGIYWLIATNDINTPLMSVMGQTTYNTLGQAEQAQFGDLDLTGLPISEFRVLYKLIIDASTNFTNAVKAKQVEFQDWRLVTGTTTPLSTNAIDVAFRETPQTVFTNDTTANTAWRNFVNNTFSWTDYATRWSATPVLLSNAVANISGSNVSGNAYTYVTTTGNTVYRFVPAAYSANNDGFWANATNIGNVGNLTNVYQMANIITSRNQ